MVTKTNKSAATPAKPQRAMAWEPITKSQRSLNVTEGVKVKTSKSSNYSEYWFMSASEEGLSLYSSGCVDCSGPYSADEVFWLSNVGGLNAEQVLDHLDALEALISRFRQSVNKAAQP